MTKPSPEAIIHHVCEAFRCDKAEVYSGTRNRRVAMARGMIIDLLRSMTRMSYPEIAVLMQCTSHSTVVTAHKRYKQKAKEGAYLSEIPGCAELYGKITDIRDRVASMVMTQWRAKTILSIDPGFASTGWALMVNCSASGSHYMNKDSPPKLVDYGNESLSKLVDTDSHRRWASLTDALLSSKLLEHARTADYIVVETSLVSSAYGNRRTQRLGAMWVCHGVLIGAIQAATGVPVETVDVTEWKRGVLGKPNAPKAHVESLVCNLYPNLLQDKQRQDVYDAIALGMWWVFVNENQRMELSRMRSKAARLSDRAPKRKREVIGNAVNGISPGGLANEAADQQQHAACAASSGGILGQPRVVRPPA